ncbi:hypothetical protein [Streptomyces sp. NPDC087212]|uniref:hypothetical protein n=1 Tax=Streptomyces sp. NPDC087212 TaxID=3365766 RepID=UPI003816F1DC
MVQTPTVLFPVTDPDRQVQVVRGLVLARNADIHLPAILDLHVDHVVGEGDSYRVMPSWQPYDALPQVVRDNDKTASSCHDAYRTRSADGGFHRPTPLELRR